jgi:hypothetical protein
MTEPHRTRKPIAVGPGLAAIMDAHKGPPLRLPQTKADFDDLVAEAERDLKPVRRGRPKAGERRAPTSTHSLRLPDAVWKRLQAAAKRKHLSATAAAAIALAAWVETV